MTSLYDKTLKKKLCENICFYGASTTKTSVDFNIPLKTLENWITSFYKDPHCFDSLDSSNDFKLLNPPTHDISYDDLSNEQLKLILMKKDIEIARLKKGYMVKEGGMEKKEFVIFSKKNMK